MYGCLSVCSYLFTKYLCVYLIQMKPSPVPTNPDTRIRNHTNQISVLLSSHTDTHTGPMDTATQRHIKTDHIKVAEVPVERNKKKMVEMVQEVLSSRRAILFRVWVEIVSLYITYICLLVSCKQVYYFVR